MPEQKFVIVLNADRHLEWLTSGPGGSVAEGKLFAKIPKEGGGVTLFGKSAIFVTLPTAGPYILEILRVLTSERLPYFAIPIHSQDHPDTALVGGTLDAQTKTFLKGMNVVPLTPS